MIWGLTIVHTGAVTGKVVAVISCHLLCPPLGMGTPPWEPPTSVGCPNIIRDPKHKALGESSLHVPHVSPPRSPINPIISPQDPQKLGGGFHWMGVPHMGSQWGPTLGAFTDFGGAQCGDGAAPLWGVVEDGAALPWMGHRGVRWATPPLMATPTKTPPI